MFNKENGFTLPINLNFSDGKKYAFTFISLLIILLAIYSNSFYGDWHFDDFGNIVNNPHIQIKSFSWNEINNSFYGMAQERLSRPLAYFSFALNYYFDGENVFGYHLVNFAIHYLAAVFLFLFIYNTLHLPLLREKYSSIAYPIAMLSTFFWAINPVHVTSVTYIVQRMTSMAALFYIMSMYFYLKFRTQDKFIYSIIYFILCIFAGIAAVLSKENAVMLPLCILLFDLILIQGLDKKAVKKFSKIILLPVAIIFVLGFIFTDFSSVLGGYETRDFTMMQRLLTEPRIIIFYLSLLFYPIYSRLTLLYDIDLSTSLFHPWSTLPAIFCILLLILATVYLVKKYPLISFCIIFFFLNHIVESSFIALELIFEHRNYLPAMLLFILPSILIINVLDYFSHKKTIQFACVISVIIILTGLGDITFRRNTIISDEFNLWFDNIEKYPKLSRTHSNLGNFYLIKELKPQALHEYENAMVLNNFGSIEARATQEHNLGLYYFNEGKYDFALAYLERSYEIMPFFRSNSIHIAEIRLLKNEYPQAHRFIESELNKYSSDFDLNKMFCLILLKENNFTAAALYARKMLINDPSGYFPLSVLAETSRHKGNFQSAISFWKLYKQSLPLDPYANLALIELYAQTNNFKLLYQELAKLYCLKRNQTLFSYIKEISRNKNLLVYTPDWGRIKNIVEKRNRFF